MNPNPLPLTAAEVGRLLVDAEPYLSCDECFDRLDTFAEGLEAGAPADAALEAHLRGCPACAEEAESMVALLREDAAGPHAD